MWVLHRVRPFRVARSCVLPKPIFSSSLSFFSLASSSSLVSSSFASISSSASSPRPSALPNIMNSAPTPSYSPTLYYTPMTVSVSSSSSSSSSSSLWIQLVSSEAASTVVLPAGATTPDDFAGNAGDSLLAFSTSSTSAARRTLYVGTGPAASLSLKTLRSAVHTAISRAKELRAASVDLSLSLALSSASASNASVSLSDAAATAATVAMLSDYAFDRHISDVKRRFHISSLVIHVSASEEEAAVSQAVKKAVTVAQGTIMARNLANERADVATPQFFEEAARHTVEEFPSLLSVSVLDAPQLLASGLHLLHSVGRAAVVAPRLVLVSYRNAPTASDKTLALVGKGVTFDTGGLNLKTQGGIELMYMDCHGAATVLATVRTIAALGLRVNVVGVLALAENAISGNAYKPFEILRSHRGLSVRIDNTDAEGRLCLADAMSYVQSTDKSVDQIVDVATLTGACAVALGEYCGGMFANDDATAAALSDIGVRVDERVWRMPILDEHVDEIKGKECDLHSMGKGRYGGACTAAAFLSQFVYDGVKWCHLDIAGAGMASAPRGYVCANGTGFGVSLLTEYVSKHRSSTA
eukprot:ANDGO_05104.mRNA.1 putative cytosol aminopeptidase